VIPGENILGVMGLKNPLAPNVAKDPLSDRMLEALQELGSEGRGFVEAEAAGWVNWVGGTRFRIDPLKESIDDGQVKVKVWIEAGAEAMQETHDRHRGRGRRRGTSLSQGGLKGPEQDVQHGGGSLRAVVKEGPQALGDRQHELADREPTSGSSSCWDGSRWPLAARHVERNGVERLDIKEDPGVGQENGGRGQQLRGFLWRSFPVWKRSLAWWRRSRLSRGWRRRPVIGAVIVAQIGFDAPFSCLESGGKGFEPMAYSSRINHDSFLPHPYLRAIDLDGRHRTQGTPPERPGEAYFSPFQEEGIRVHTASTGCRRGFSYDS